MAKLPSGVRRVYNALYKLKASGRTAYTPTPSEIKDYFDTNNLNHDSITDDEFHQAVNHFCKGELSTDTQNKIDTTSNNELEIVSPNNKPEPITSAKHNQIVISNSDKQALVSSQSSALGFTLTEEETIAVADSIDDVFNDYSSFISSVTNAIKGYIAHKFDTIEHDLESSTTEVREYLAARTNQLNEKVSGFADNVKSIQTDTTEIRNSLKTSQAAVLTRFRCT